MIDEQWGATMVLTEPDAGSDVGAGRTKAIQQPDGTWHIEGVKRFITSAEHDMTENIVHLVLARPEGAGPGTKGLSMFLVPKFHVDLETGELGERNGVYVTNVEKKMGLKVSTTCELTFGEKRARPSAGWSATCTTASRQMFKVIEYARMMVGTKAIATLSTGYLNALDYAKTRVQGADLTRMADKTAPRVHDHPPPGRAPHADAAEGVRGGHAGAGALHRDLAGRGRSGRGRGPRPTTLAAGSTTCCCRSSRASARSGPTSCSPQSLQTLGGSGYLQDYPIEQYIRDAKIDTLYEGTTAIQGLDLFFRKIVRDQGAALTALADRDPGVRRRRRGQRRG